MPYASHEAKIQRQRERRALARLSKNPPGAEAHRAPQSPPARMPSPVLMPLPPPPRPSMYAVGGRPGPGLVPAGPGYALSPDLYAASFFGKAETMLAALAAKSDEQERRIAALEKTVAFNGAAGQTAKSLARAIVGLIGVRLP